ncbi:unnamed protein product [Dovyalis caffra]|uniref:Uncharacterized protein n=1 Tax=Dovyalis caffra TaxID=77055 RepID=A0AAV1RXN3_9ROSI|nr:unnamed protein product [Dovyalis caffra]
MVVFLETRVLSVGSRALAKVGCTSFSLVPICAVEERDALYIIVEIDDMECQDEAHVSKSALCRK